jgi:3',5'-cyclic AMP phosphodiesterase CpdA
MEVLKRILLFVMAGFLGKACQEIDMSGMFINDVTVNQRFEQSRNWMDLAPDVVIEVPEDNYQLYSMGDSHVGGTQNLDALLGRASEAKAAAVVMVGDLTTGHAEDFDILLQHLPFPDALPTFLMVGNHDLYFDGWDAFHSRFGPSTYLFFVKTPVATDLYICLDTGGATLGRKQLDWLEEVLEKSRASYRRCVIFTHNNLFRFRRTASTNPNVEELVVLLDLFSRHQVDMVVTAHDHEHFAQQFGFTTHIVMDALKDGLDNAGYCLIEIKEGELSYNFQQIN